MESLLESNNKEGLKATETQEEEEDLVIYEDGDIIEGVLKCKHSIVGKLITEKTINPGWVHNAMYNIWKKPEGFQMKEIQDKLYQFFFEKESDMKRVLKGSPWMFRNSWLLMEKWERNTNPKDMDFSSSETTKLGSKLAAVVGEVVDCSLYDGGNGQGLAVTEERRSKQGDNRNKTQVQPSEPDKEEVAVKNGKDRMETEQNNNITRVEPNQELTQITTIHDKPKGAMGEDHKEAEESEENTGQISSYTEQGEGGQKKWKRRARETDLTKAKMHEGRAEPKKKFEKAIPMETEEGQKQLKKHQLKPPTAEVAKQPCRGQ
ncbi:hypothetical protein PIB30_045819 [Stylosanthes scabra]|uniref:DUF4283 domain-containing protein n=1 Tax=Stylosanthes scabra TaxID=79078 RepID=A0ABU6SG54_9FABA|nr:hypothetical protein [Stylosanthes scabra]